MKQMRGAIVRSSVLKFLLMFYAYMRVLLLFLQVCIFMRNKLKLLTGTVIVEEVPN